MQPISETDLILNPDGSIYHLNLLPEDIAETIITVGDPDRVGEVSKYFDRIDREIPSPTWNCWNLLFQVESQSLHHQPSFPS